MKAVIMAGGKGTRLRPLTSHMPKPMVPLLNRPCMEYIVDLLKKHGITEIAVTVQYLPDVIKSYFGDGSRFGVNIHYFEESSPLGTAGSVKNCQDFLDERFVVISGDALTDIHLTNAIHFHEQRSSMATLVLTQVEHPLEFGVVMTGDDGKVIRFLEKPGWSEVFSDTVNTGIYILEPEIFRYIEEKKEVDFSKDIFPALLKQNLPMFGYRAEGYWSDIGSLDIYRQAQFDMLDGKLEVDVKAKEVAPRIYMEPDVRIDSSVKLEGPVYIGGNSHLKYGSSVGPYTILGNNSIVSIGSRLTQTILWDSVCIAKKAEISGSTLCHSIHVGDNCTINEGTVIGSHSKLGARSFVKAGVKIWPYKEVGESAVVNSSLIYVDKVTKHLFGQQGISGYGNIDVTPEFVTRLGAAYAFLRQPGSRIALSACSHPFAQLLKHSMMTSLCLSGIDTIDFGISTAPLTRFGIKTFGCDGGIHISMKESPEEKQVLIQFFDHSGLPVSRDEERKIENAYWQETFARAHTEELGALQVEHNVQVFYQQSILASIDRERLIQRGFRLLIDCEQRFWPTFLGPLFANLGITPLFGKRKNMSDGSVDFGVRFDKNGETFQLFLPDGSMLDAEQQIALQIMACYRNRSGVTIGLPVSAPMELELLARFQEMKVVRTKVTPRAMMEVAASETFHPLFDSIYSLIKILAYLTDQKQTLSEVVAMLPLCYMERTTVFCPSTSKGMVMRKMMEEMKGKELELLDGIKIYDASGWVLILPDPEESHVSVISQAACRQSASHLASAFAKRIHDYQQA